MTNATRYTYVYANVKGVVYGAAVKEGDTIIDMVERGDLGLKVAAKSRSGTKIHARSRGGQAWCNQNMRTGGALTAGMLRHANPAHFCDKCFSADAAALFIAAAQG